MRSGKKSLDFHLGDNGTDFEPEVGARGIAVGRVLIMIEDSLQATHSDLQKLQPHWQMR